ncbi:transcriptional regulator [Candidatus Bathyarchaeota archaeon]|nr:transcriptional regulator [Candidatus Bathyarchaeota archaeon]
MRRNNLDIFADILRAARQGARKTRIVYQANLNFKIVEGYIRSLVLRGFLEALEDGTYVTSQRGLLFLQQYEELVSSMEAPKPAELPDEIAVYPYPQSNRRFRY